jgi:hypothetical protein
MSPVREINLVDIGLVSILIYLLCITTTYFNTGTTAIDGLSSYSEETPSMPCLQEVYPERVGEV